MKKDFLLFVMIVEILFMFILCGCSETVSSYSDELSLNNWSATLDNKAKVSLEFEDDDAVFEIVLSDKQKVVISGLCEIDQSRFVIHDRATKTPYAFSYIVHFDRVEIVYDENTVSLYKT